MSEVPLPRVPWWGVSAAAAVPVVYVGGWLYAGAVTRGYDPVRSTVSDLAAGDAPTRWPMALALVLTGLAYAVAAVGLRPADVAGRGVLFLGGVAILITAWIPNTSVGRNAVGHMIATYLAYASLSAWPAVIAVNRADAPFVLRRRFGQVTALVLGALVVLTVVEIVTDGPTLGLRERVLTTAQSIVPMVVVVGTLLGRRGGPRSGRRSAP